jgi:myb proto-oncogene protein
MTDFGKIAARFNSPIRTAKQCRDRWHNYLRPGIKKGGWTKEEEKMIMELHAKYGGK